MMDVAHFYHVFAANDNWRNAVGEHLAALEDGGYDGTFHVGIVGPEYAREQVLDELMILRPPDTVVEAYTGWEQVTIQKLHDYSREHDGAVLYGHTKGTHNVGPFQEVWRQWMTWNVVVHWRDVASELESRDDLDAIGCHWLTKEEFPHIVVDTNFPMFGGNFWMARCEYLRTLPPVGMERRHEAESWIGLGNPRVFDLSPGWPGSWPYPHRPTRRLIVGR